MSDGAGGLRAVDEVTITVLVDNYVDLLLPGDGRVTRPPLARDGQILAETLLAEHGLSLLIDVRVGREQHTVLLDTGYSQDAMLRNADLLGVDMTRVEAVVVSHGHMDHTGGLGPLLERLPESVPVVVHPDAFIEARFVEQRNGARVKFPFTMRRDRLERAGAKFVESPTPTFLAADTVIVTGEVPRSTPFERGMANALIERDGQIERDTIADDQAVIISLGGRGVVVVSGCAHSGIVNTVRYARELAGGQPVVAVVGGFHLPGPEAASIVSQTVDALVGESPALLGPMHCTGRYATERLRDALPDAFVLASVGSTITVA